MNEIDRQLLMESLSDLREELLASGPGVASPAAIRENTSAIESAGRKLKRITSAPQDFSAQELKVMYWAVFDLRATTHDFLNSAPFSDPDRAVALETQRACNRLLRSFAGSLSQAGIDIRALFRD